MWKKFVSLALFCGLLNLTGCSLMASKPKLDDSAGAQLAPIPEELSLAYVVGLTLLKEQKFSEALGHWQGLATQWPDYPGVWVNLALSQWHEQQYAQSLISAQTALSINAEFCPALSVQGLLLRENGQFQAAIASYEQAMSCDPHNPDIPYNLGIVYDLYLQQSAQALAEYQKAQSLDAGQDTALAMWITDLQSRLPQQLAGEAE